jgi:hypothetical protein
MGEGGAREGCVTWERDTICGKLVQDPTKRPPPNHLPPPDPFETPPFDLLLSTELAVVLLQPVPLLRLDDHPQP